MEELLDGLMRHKKQSVTPVELEGMISSAAFDGEEFAKAVVRLEDEGYLTPVKNQGRQLRAPYPANKYRLNRGKINRRFHQELHRARLEMSSTLISLDAYFKLDPAVFVEEWPMIQKVDDYLTTRGLPDDEVTAEERSVTLVNDEKWITERGGKKLLERIGVWDKLKIIPVSDPLMFAVNPNRLSPVDGQLHLIVENKTTFQALIQVIAASAFTTIIFGGGWRAVASLEQLERQVPLSGEKTVLYFGDLDHEGLAIWHQLYLSYDACPALPFYEACLKKAPNKGKENQKQRPKALDAFKTFLAESDQSTLQEMLNEGRYVPQEALTTKELQRIGLMTPWQDMTLT
ncbi:Wadjet anti-phage system protein JetD domain-containing protein [Salisediminibacterium beveridgei]|nr:Wadjet anti-phage system protein JetD domain-containing protein [Salisediminibacterium beveridgei]